MRGPRLAWLLVAVLAGCGGASATANPFVDPGSDTAQPPGQRPPMVLTQQIVRDPFAGDIDAMTFLLPDGWQAEAGVQWLPEWRRVAFLQTRVTKPTGLTIEWLPIQDFIYFPPPPGLPAPPIGGNYQGKAYVPPVTDPAQFVRDFWMSGDLAHLQNATLVSVDQVPAVADYFVQSFGAPAQAAAYRMRYEFDQDGQPWEEEVNFALLFAGTPELSSWFVNFAYTVRAPLGGIAANQGVTSTVVASRQTTPAWEANYQIVQALFTQGVQQQMADTVAFGQLLAQHRAESEALQQQVVADRQRSQDEIARLRGESLAGVQSYTNPNDGTVVQLPQGWGQYWVNAQGQYVVSDQPGFDPNSLGGGGGFQLLQPR